MTIPIGTGDGSTTTFQLVKVYTYGAQSATRTIVKPMAGGLSDVRGGGGAWKTIRPTLRPGMVTFWTPPGAGAGGECGGTFEVPTRFNQNVLPITRVALNVYSLERVELQEVRLETLV